MNLTLRSVYKDGQEGIKVLYEIMRSRSTENDPYVNISHTKIPPYRKHATFVRSKPYRSWYLVKVDGLVAGSVTITKLNEVGIVLLPDYRGRGIGKKAMQMLLARSKPLPAISSHRAGRFIANINPLNERSISLFTSLGFRLKQQTYEL